MAVRQMEAKGITTDKGDLNRWIKNANSFLRSIGKKIIGLADWLKAIKEELSKPQAPNLAELLGAYYTARNARAWSNKAKAGNLKDFANAVNYLTEKSIATLEDLDVYLAAHREQTKAINAAMKALSARKKELEDLLHFADLYRETKPIYDELRGIKWKGQRE